MFRIFISVVTALAMMISAYAPGSAVFAKEAGISVSVIPTGIEADSVRITDGYGSLYIEPDYELDTYPQAALIDENGGFVFPYKETWLRYYCNDGIISLADSAYAVNYLYDNDYILDKPAFYKEDGSEAFHSDYEAAYPMNDGYTFVIEHGWWNNNNGEVGKAYIIDSEGNVTYEFPSEFSNSIDQGAGGSFSTFFDCAAVAGMYREGLIGIYSHTAEENPNSPFGNIVTSVVGYFNAQGEMKIDLSDRGYTNSWPFYEGYAGVRSADSLYGFINKEGDEAIPCMYDDFNNFCDGLGAVKVDGKWGYINTANETVIPFEYDGAYRAGNGLCVVGNNGKAGFVDYSNNVVVPLEYDDVSSFEDGTAYAIKDRRVYILRISDGSASNPPLEGNADTVYVKINGEELTFDQPPIIANNRTLVPLRAIFEAMGATVDWDQDTKTVTSSKGDIHIKLAIGSNILYRTIQR